MSSKYSENIVMYLVLSALILIFSGFVRYIFISLGLDEFTANIAFIVAIILGVSIYDTGMKLLQGLYSIIIKNISKRKKMKQNKMEQEGVEKVNIIKEDNSQALKKDNSEFQEKHPNVITDIEEIQKIREQKQQEKNIVVQEKLKIAIGYTKKEFSPYTSVENLEILCENIKIYAEKGNFENIKPINVEELTVKDLRHFGWNIWNHFDTKTKQKQVGLFLKKTFSKALENITIESLIGNLKVDENEGLIKIIKHSLISETSTTD